jgi:hypothetical protein
MPIRLRQRFFVIPAFKAERYFDNHKNAREGAA